MAVLSPIAKQIRALFRRVRLKPQQLHVYQRQAIEFLKDNPFSALFIDMGLGKTSCVLTMIVELLLEDGFCTGDPILIVAPRRVACETWPAEIANWLHTAGMSYSLIHARDDDPRVRQAAAFCRKQGRLAGHDEKAINSAAGNAETVMKGRIRIDAAHKRADVHIISRDWLEWLCDYWGVKWPYRTVIIDESSSFKDHKSGRFRAMKDIRCSTRNLITRLHLLTASPAAETYEHLFPQMFLLDKGAALGHNITTYRKTYFSQNQYNKKWELRPNGEKDILAKIAHMTLVMKAKDYLKLPEPLIIKQPVRLDEKSMALYRELQKDFMVKLEDGTEVEAETAAALSQKLLQLASGVLYETYLDKDLETDDMKKVKKIHKIHNFKLDALAELVDNLDGKPVIVVYHHQASLHRIKAAFPKAVVMDKDGKCIPKWNSGKIPMLLVHPQSAGHGLNLQEGGHNMIFFDLPWSLENYEQVIGRLARQGQLMTVVVHILSAVGTLDEAVFEALMRKQSAQTYMFKTLKRFIALLKAGKPLVIDDEEEELEEEFV